MSISRIVTTSDTSASSFICVDQNTYIYEDISKIKSIICSNTCVNLYLPVWFQNSLIYICSNSSSSINIYLPIKDGSNYKYDVPIILESLKYRYIQYSFVNLPIVLSVETPNPPNVLPINPGVQFITFTLSNLVPPTSGTFSPYISFDCNPTIFKQYITPKCNSQAINEMFIEFIGDYAVPSKYTILYANLQGKVDNNDDSGYAQISCVSSTEIGSISTQPTKTLLKCQIQPLEGIPDPPTPIDVWKYNGKVVTSAAFSTYVYRFFVILLPVP